MAIVQFFIAHRTAAGVRFLTFVTSLCSVPVIIAVFVVTLGVLLYKHKYAYAKAFILGLAIAEPVTFLAKLFFHRARPLNAALLETDYSFPSGHATAAVALYGFIAFLLIKQQKTIQRKRLVGIVAVLFILLIGFSRLYLGVHYFTDVIAGYIVGGMGLSIGLALV